MVSNLKEIIPGAESWPRFVRNRSEQFEARLAPIIQQKFHRTGPHIIHRLGRRTEHHRLETGRAVVCQAPGRAHDG